MRLALCVRVFDFGSIALCAEFEKRHKAKIKSQTQSVRREGAQRVTVVHVRERA